MFSRVATRVLSKNIISKSMITSNGIRTFASHGGSAGGAYPGEPEPGTQMIEVKVFEGDAVYSYKHRNFIIDQSDLKEDDHDDHHHHHAVAATAEHVHGPGCAHGHHEEAHAKDGHHDDHHDDHHHEVDPDDIEDEYPRGFFLNTPPSTKYPINPYFLTGVLGIPVLAALYCQHFFNNEANTEYENFKQEYFTKNPEFKKLYDNITHNYPLSH